MNIKALNQKYILITLSIFFIFQSFTGIIKYYFTNYNITLLIYVPNILMIMYIVLHFYKIFYTLKISKTFFLILSIFFIATLNSLFYIQNIYQILFGYYIFIVMFFGFLAYDIFKKDIHSYISFITILLLIINLGVILNVYYEYPWTTINYMIGNMEIESAKKLTYFGENRYAGFGLSSYSTASIILVLSALVLSFTKKPLNIFLIWLSSFISITITTSKAPIIAITIIGIILIIKKILFKYRLANLFIYLLVLIGIFLPFSTYFVKYKFTNSEILFASFSDRLANTWPNVFHLLEHHGSLIFGRGIGGIGTSQKNFEVLLYNPGDNLYMFLYGNFGLFFIFFVLFYLIKLTNIDKKTNYGFFIYLYSIVLFVNGISISTLELSIFSLIFGFILAEFISNKKGNT